MTGIRNTLTFLGVATAFACANETPPEVSTDAPVIGAPTLKAVENPTQRIEGWRSTRPGHPLPANVGFGVTVSDAAILSLVKRYKVEPRALFMSTGGLTYSHRVYEQRSADSVVAQARAGVAVSATKGIQSGRGRYQRFVRSHGVEDVASSELLQRRARSLLSLRACLEEALVRSRGGQPMVFAMEVVGDPSDIERLGRDPRVKLFEPGLEFQGRVVVPRTRKPDAYAQGCSDRNVQKMGARAAYDQLLQLAARQN